MLESWIFFFIITSIFPFPRQIIYNLFIQSFHFVQVEDTDMGVIMELFLFYYIYFSIHSNNDILDPLFIHSFFFQVEDTDKGVTIELFLHYCIHFFIHSINDISDPLFIQSSHFVQVEDPNKGSHHGKRLLEKPFWSPGRMQFFFTDNCPFKKNRRF